MAKLPDNVSTLADLMSWYEIKQKLDKLKYEESVLRKKLFSDFFVNPKEGTNKMQLEDGYVLNAQHVINRKIDEAALDSLKPALEAEGIVVDNVVRWKPEVNIGVYRKLSDEDRKKFDTVLIITDGSPQMSIVKPKKV